MLGLPCSSNGKESAFSAGDQTWFWKILWKREWQSTPVFFSGESHGERSLVGYSPRGHKEVDMIEQLNTHMLDLVLRNVESGFNDCGERSGKQRLALDTGE